MNQTQITLPEKKLLGIQVRTNNQTEIDPMTGKIFPIVQRFFHEKLFEKLPHRKKPGTTFCCYTDYENEIHGDYTYFIGEEVDSLAVIPEGLTALTIPAQTYAKFTTQPAPMPAVVRNAWFSIWKMTDADLGGKRHFATDFEIYDERASDHQNIVMDLYIGIEK
ncbi:MAG: effector binding domain-containing protein [Proteobacteria bacterium]|nr:effector binding domain-containing protein [Pseudomonadota bacterium]